MRTDSGIIYDHANRNNNWDNADGLGWQLWRRNRTSSLSSESIQLQVERFRSNGLFHSPSLADDIQRRRQINLKYGAYPFNSELPLFSAAYTLPYTKNPTPHLQTYPQHVANSPAHPLPSRHISPNFATVVPRITTFSGHTIQKKKAPAISTQQIKPYKNTETSVNHSTRHQESVSSAGESTLATIDKKKDPGFERPKIFPDTASHQDAGQLPNNIGQNKIIQKNNETAPPVKGSPLVHVRSTESLINLASQKGNVQQGIVQRGLMQPDIVQDILRRKPAPNQFHAASPSKTQDRSPLYFAGLLKLSDPGFHNKLPLLFPTPLQRLTNYQIKDSTTTISNGESPRFAAQKENSPSKRKTVMRKHSANSTQPDDKSEDQSKNDTVGEAKNSADPIYPAAHDVLLRNWSSNHTGFSNPSTSLSFKELPSGQTSLYPASRLQPLRAKEIPTTSGVVDTIKTWLSPTPHAEINRKSSSPQDPSKPARPGVNNVLSGNRSGSFTGFSSPLTSQIFKKSLPPFSSQTLYYPASRLQPLEAKELSAAPGVPDTIKTWLSLTPHSEENRNSSSPQDLSKPARPGIHNVLSGNWSGSLTGFPSPLTSLFLKKSLPPSSNQTVPYPTSRLQPLGAKKVTTVKQLPDTTATRLSPSPGPYSAQIRKSIHLKEGKIQQLSDPKIKNTSKLQTMSSLPFSSFTSLTLQRARRVTESTMGKVKPLGNSYHNKNTNNTPSVMSFKEQHHFPKYSPISLQANDVASKANALKLPPALSTQVLRDTAPSVKKSDFPGKTGPNILADISMASHPLFSTLQQAPRVMSDKTVQQPDRAKDRVKDEGKEVTHPVKSQEVNRHFSMENPVQPTPSLALYAKTANSGKNPDNEHTGISSRGISTFGLPAFSLVQGQFTKAKTEDGYTVPHNVIVQRKSLANPSPLDMYGKILGTPTLNVAGNHRVLSEAGTIPSPITPQPTALDSPPIVERQENKLFYPEARKSFGQHFTHKATANPATSRLFLKRSAPPIADQALTHQVIQVQSKNESIEELSFAGQEMPLAPAPSSQGSAHFFSNNAGSNQTVQTSLLNPAEGISASGVVSAPPANTGRETGTSTTETDQPQAAIDLDELVEKTWLKIMRKLTIERERRGHNKWI